MTISHAHFTLVLKLTSVVSVFLVVRLNFTETWGDEYYLGLTGIEVLGENFESIPVDMEWMEVQSFHISWH